MSIKMPVSASFYSSPLFAGSITKQGSQWVVPNDVTIPVISGDGIGPEITTQAERLVQAAIQKAYGNKRTITWLPITAGKKAEASGQGLLPQATIDAFKQHRFIVKAPLETPIGEGFRSLNVTLRQLFDLFACIRPFRLFPGVQSPLKKGNPDIVIFRENTEDVYQGVEFPKDSDGAKRLIALLQGEGHTIRPDSGLGIKPISEFASKRLIEKAFRFAIDNHRPSVTVVHKGNIMKFTEGAFLNWAKEVAKTQFPNEIILPEQFKTEYGGDFKKIPPGKVLFQERIADAMFQDAIQNPEWHSVIVTMNLNGDYLSDAVAATVGGLGMAPGANIGDNYAMFEATHGTAPDIAGQNKANPTAMFLTMVMMLNEMGWHEAATAMVKAIEKALSDQQMTGDLARTIPGAKALGCSEYTDQVIQRL